MNFSTLDIGKVFLYYPDENGSTTTEDIIGSIETTVEKLGDYWRSTSNLILAFGVDDKYRTCFTWAIFNPECSGEYITKEFAKMSMILKSMDIYLYKFSAMEGVITRSDIEQTIVREMKINTEAESWF